MPDRTEIEWRSVPDTRVDAAKGFPEFKVSEGLVRSVARFHEGLPGYAVTPLHSLGCKAAELGIGELWVKDEARRLGLNAFKVLGGSYAIARWMARDLGIKPEEMSYDRIMYELRSRRAQTVTFVTATDGNHGRGVAWASRMMGSKAEVFMPKGAAEARIKAIEGEGGKVFVTDRNYDGSVRIASGYARDNGGVLIQDTSWQGYEEVPMWIMQGYLTVMYEALSQIRVAGSKGPSHVILQAGVGSFAGSMLSCLECMMGGSAPVAVIVEPKNAACLYESSKDVGSGLVKVTGPLDTIMAGLACGEPNPSAWGTILRLSSFFASCEDSVAILGMKSLYRPMGSDGRVISGESGAVGMGVLQLVMTDERLLGLKEAMHIDEGSSVLLISTEGDTDPVGFWRIIEG